MTLEKTIKLLKKEYERAKKLEYIHNPMPRLCTKSGERQIMNDLKVKYEIQSFDLPNPMLHRPKAGSARKVIYNFELCADYEELKATLHAINHLGFDLISVTQDGRGVYTLFFRRPI